MKTVTLEQARSPLLQLAARANAGEPSLVTQHGKPIAAIVPPEMLQAVQQPRRTSFLGLRGSGKGLWQPTTAEYIARLRDEWE